MILVVPPNHTKRFAFPHLGVTLLGSMLKKEGLPFSIFDCQTHRDHEAALMKEVMCDGTVGFYTSTFSYGFVEAMSKRIKNECSDARIVLGGPHATHMPSELIDEFADIVVAGEAEFILPRILKGEDLSAVPSVAYRNETGMIVENERAGFIQDLDSIPFPDWGLVDHRKYSTTLMRRKPLASIMSSRGCIYKCIYCSKKVQGYGMRYRSIGNVVEEMQRDHDLYGVREIHFFDDNLTLKPDRVKSLCEAIISKGLNRKLLFGIGGGIRPDKGDQEMFDLMKRAGFYFVAIAVENPDRDISKRLGRGLDPERNFDAIGMARKAGLFIHTFHILGSPFDTKQSMRENIEFARRSAAHVVFFFMMRPYPGTELHEMLSRENKITGKQHDEVSSVNELSGSYSANDWDAGELKHIMKYAYRRVYTRPWRMIRLMANVPFMTASFVVLMKILMNMVFGGAPSHDSVRARYRQEQV